MMLKFRHTWIPKMFGSISFLIPKMGKTRTFIPSTRENSEFTINSMNATKEIFWIEIKGEGFVVPEKHPNLCMRGEAFEARVGVCRRWPTLPCLSKVHEEMDQKGKGQWRHHHLHLLRTLVALSLASEMLTLEHLELKRMIQGSLVSNQSPKSLWANQGRRWMHHSTQPPYNRSHFWQI